MGGKGKKNAKKTEVSLYNSFPVRIDGYLGCGSASNESHEPNMMCRLLPSSIHLYPPCACSSAIEEVHVPSNATAAVQPNDLQLPDEERPRDPHRGVVATFVLYYGRKTRCTKAAR